MKTTIIKVKSIATDSASGQSGMVTHFHQSATGGRQYHIQPKGLNPETQHPVDGVWAVESLIKDATFVEVDLPLDVIGTIVTDQASGFSGTAVALTLHTNGCVHIEVQAKGQIAKTLAPIKVFDFDIRRLTGVKVPKLTEEEIVRSERRHPSPSGTATAPMRG